MSWELKAMLDRMSGENEVLREDRPSKKRKKRKEATSTGARIFTYDANTHIIVL